MRKKIALFCFFLLLPLASMAKTYPAYYAPNFLANTYFGVGLGYANNFYNNSYLRPGLTASHFQQNQFGFSVFIGHYFAKNWAWQVRLIQPSGVHTHNINGMSNKFHITQSTFAFTLDPSIWVNQRFGLFAEVGPTYLNRKSDNFGGAPIDNDSDHWTGLVGGGLQYFVLPTFLTRLTVDYTFKRNNSIPPQFYIGLSGAYYFAKNKQTTSQLTYFPQHEFTFSFFDANATDVEYSETHIPVFWCGSTKLQYGGMGAYRQMIFHSANLVSIDLGVNVGHFKSRRLSQNVSAFSLFAGVRFWLLRFKAANMYLGLIAGGPSYISRKVLDGNDLGSHFIFFDQLRLGFIFGEKHHVDVGVQFAHYSNGNLCSHNPGVSIPLSLSIGYAF